jgi:2-polyprenyl-6-methoxyphenol hydroxylase-like FAD-dependent oxidoreductase
VDAVTVLVVGAGPTGLLAAAELRRRGIDCMLIEAHNRALGWDRATVVHPRSLEIFEQLGIVEPLLKAGVKQRKATLHAGGEMLGEIDLSLCGSRYPFNIGISEEVTEAILAGYLASQGGRVTRGTKLVDLDQDADGVRATVEHGGVRHDIRADWVVGCDGYHSAVRTLAGIEQDGHDIAEPWAVFDANVPGWTEGFEGNFGYLDDVPVILTSLPGERWRVYLRPSSPDSDLVADALSTLRRYMPDVGFEAVANPARFQCHSMVARSYRSGRILLAGDAAHTCSPAQGHGMNAGLQDAYNLAWKLALVCQGQCSEKLLDSYEAERRPVALMVAKSGDDADSGQLLRDPEEREKRDAAIRDTLADTEQRHHEAVAEAELDIDYAASPIVAGDRHAALWPGQRLPDWVAVGHAGIGRGTLHGLASRKGHTALLIGGPAASGEALAAARRALAAEAAADGVIVERAFSLTADPDAAADAKLDAAAAEMLGVEDIVLLVVRSDGHVGLCAERDHAAALGGYVALLRGG